MASNICVFEFVNIMFNDKRILICVIYTEYGRGSLMPLCTKIEFTGISIHGLSCNIHLWYSERILGRTSSRAAGNGARHGNH